MRAITISGSLFTLLFGTCWFANAQDKAAIEQKLIAQYALTQPTADNTNIVTAGAVLVLKKSNLMMAPVSDTNFYQNTYKDGKIDQNGIGKANKTLNRFRHLPGTSIIPGASAMPAAPDTRTWVAGEKLWVTKIEAKKDGVTFQLFTDAVKDVRYKAALRFAFPPNIELTTDQVEKLVAEVFGVQPAEDASAKAQPQQTQPPPGGAQPPVEVAPTPIPPPPPPPAAEAAPPPIPPPPPPMDQPQAAPTTTSIGQTIDEVVANLGQPKSIFDKGATKIYVYKDIKITFTKGKVIDIQ
jgi:hypothetical protein